MSDEPLTFQPVLYNMDRINDREALRELARQYRELTAHDELETQLASLITIRHPERCLEPAEVEARAREHLGGCTPHNYGVWVYYPWSRRLVHLVREEEFIELRTSRNRYKITAEEQEALAVKAVGIVGLSVGQSVAITMAMERSCGELRLADFDRLELTNLNRLRAGVHELGLPKVILAARQIAEIDPFLPVRCFPEGITADNLDRFLLEDGPLSLLVEECDSLDIKVLCRERARELRIPVIMDTSDRGMLDVERFDLEPERPLFHGWADLPSSAELAGLTAQNKVPLILSILRGDTLSTRLRASLLEIGKSLTTWPQLASSVALGGAVTGDVCRRILLGARVPSGRFHVDVEALVAEPFSATPPSATPSAPPLLDDNRMKRLAATVAPQLPTSSMLLERSRIRQLVAAAVRAPSGGNAQPWKFLFRDGRLYLFRDEAFPSFLDLDRRATYLALGAAAENLVLEAHHLGLEVTTRTFPHPEDDQLVAVFCFHAGGIRDAMDLEPHTCGHLATEIVRRQTNRKLAPRQLLPPDDLAALREVARTAGADLLLADAPGDLRELGEVVGAAERLRLLHPAGHAEFVREVRWTREEAEQTRGGLDLDTVELTAAERAGLMLAKSSCVVDHLRRWDRGAGFAAMAQKAISSASAMALIRIQGIRAHDFFRAGRVVERIWLEATRREIAVQPLTALLFLLARLERPSDASDPFHLPEATRTELVELRDRFAQIFPSATGHADILLLRLARAPAPPVRSLRRGAI